MNHVVAILFLIGLVICVREIHITLNKMGKGDKKMKNLKIGEGVKALILSIVIVFLSLTFLAFVFTIYEIIHSL
jgi:TM2 domain-containing membrane protein YozV